MLPFYIYIGCGLVVFAMLGYMVGVVVGEDRAEERARRAAQDHEATSRGVHLLGERGWS